MANESSQQSFGEILEKGARPHHPMGILVIVLLLPGR